MTIKHMKKKNEKTRQNDEQLFFFYVFKYSCSNSVFISGSVLIRFLLSIMLKALWQTVEKYPHEIACKFVEKQII